MQKKFTMDVVLITDPEKGETFRSGMIETLRAMADGLERGELVGGTPTGGHWNLNLNGTNLDD